MSKRRFPLPYPWLIEREKAAELVLNVQRQGGRARLTTQGEDSVMVEITSHPNVSALGRLCDDLGLRIHFSQTEPTYGFHLVVAPIDTKEEDFPEMYP